MHGEGIHEHHDQAPTPGRVFLDRLFKGESIEDSGTVAVVVAHSDDESIAFGAQIKQFPKCTMVHMATSASSDPYEWESRGYSTREEYEHTRELELTNALHIAGHLGPRNVLNNVDQQVALHLAENARALAALFTAQGIKYVLTHAYEGGHPDHDAVAFAVHAAKKLIEREGGSLTLIEAPLYRSVGGKTLMQDFVPIEGTKTYSLALTPEQQELKTKLYQAHTSQQNTFTNMSVTTETLREAPPYDFTSLPNGGELFRLYDRSGMRDQWTTLTTEALRQLDLGLTSLFVVPDFLKRWLLRVSPPPKYII
jgi:LmbE family N-acetylglucosaminyl deacetylase